MLFKCLCKFFFMFPATENMPFELRTFLQQLRTACKARLLCSLHFLQGMRLIGDPFPQYIAFSTLLHEILRQALYDSSLCRMKCIRFLPKLFLFLQ